MAELNERMKAIWEKAPASFHTMPVSDKGYPVPWFVAWLDENGKSLPRGEGKPDFRVVDPARIIHAHNHGKCWICGGLLGKYRTFLIGPMRAVNRVTSEPPSHNRCATFAAIACPFLLQPKMRRNEKDLPERGEVSGIMVKRNPGVSLCWTTFRYHPFKVDNGGLFKIGDPERLEWYAEGRMATRDEILESIESGLPILRDMAREEGPQSVTDLEKQITAGMALVPA